MKPFIRIVRKPYEEPYHLHLVVMASNGRQRGELDIYTNVWDLELTAGRLRELPIPGESAVLWELGSERPEDRFAFYFRVCLLRLSPTGQCAIELRFNNNRVPPDREVTEFSVHALPADLDRLAGLLEQFGRLEHRVLEWNVEEGELRDGA